METKSSKWTTKEQDKELPDTPAFGLRSSILKADLLAKSFVEKYKDLSSMKSHLDYRKTLYKNQKVQQVDGNIFDAIDSPIYYRGISHSKHVKSNIDGEFIGGAGYYKDPVNGIITGEDISTAVFWGFGDRHNPNRNGRIIAFKIDPAAIVMEYKDVIKLRKQMRKEGNYIKRFDDNITLFALRMNIDMIFNAEDYTHVIIKNKYVVVDKRTLNGGQFDSGKILKSLDKDDTRVPEEVEDQFEKMYTPGKNSKDSNTQPLIKPEDIFLKQKEQPDLPARGPTPEELPDVIKNKGFVTFGKQKLKLIYGDETPDADFNVALSRSFGTKEYFKIFKEELNKLHVFKRMQSNQLIALVNEYGHRFKNTFEVNDTGEGYLEDRMFFEEKLFGITQNIRDSQKPKYGYLDNDEQNIMLSKKINQYGDIVIEFYDKVKPYTTYTINDSFWKKPAAALLSEYQYPLIDYIDSSLEEVVFKARKFIKTKDLFYFDL